ncbi:gb [Venturia nashicola]|nr:gb [Venturia nashicola]
MSDPLYELLTPYFDSLDSSSRPSPTDPTTSSYLNRLTTLSLSDLESSEAASLAQTSHAVLRSLQSLSKRSHKAIISSATELSHLSSTLPQLHESATALQDALPELETSATRFADKYRRATDTENEVLTRRRKALLLSQNADRISSVLDLPTLLSTAISSAAQSSSTNSSVNYTSALDLHAHIRRLNTLYPSSPLIKSIVEQSEREMKLLTTNLIASLQVQGIKLAGAMRTIGWLRRVAPELDESMQLQRSTAGGKLNISTSSLGSTDGALGALFLVCRLANLLTMLEALEPLRDLADQESKARRQQQASKKEGGWAGGHQTERYLKRYIEIFREQSFAIVSMYKSIFPSALPVPGSTDSTTKKSAQGDRLLPLPSPLATFPTYLVDMLFDSLKLYLPNVKERSSRDSLMTQVLYCAGSLGRLGGDFSMMLALLEDDSEDDSDSEDEEDEDVDTAEGTGEKNREWIEVMKKHRVQASRLELLASGVGTGHGKVDRSGSIPSTSTAVS